MNQQGRCIFLYTLRVKLTATGPVALRMEEVLLWHTFRFFFFVLHGAFLEDILLSMVLGGTNSLHSDETKNSVSRL